jgi:hypothetical protein
VTPYSLAPFHTDQLYEPLDRWVIMRPKILCWELTGGVVSGDGCGGLLGRRSGGRHAAFRGGLGYVLFNVFRFLELRLRANGVALVAVNSGEVPKLLRCSWTWGKEVREVRRCKGNRRGWKGGSGGAQPRARARPSSEDGGGELFWREILTA